MIITCPSGKKKFNIDINLIPSEGRHLQCGSCEHMWFYIKQESISKPLQINENIPIKDNEDSDRLKDDEPINQERKKKLKRIKKRNLNYQLSKKLRLILR